MLCGVEPRSFFRRILVGPYSVADILIEAKADIVLAVGFVPESSGIHVEESIFTDRAVCVMTPVEIQHLGAVDHSADGKKLAD